MGLQNTSWMLVQVLEMTGVPAQRGCLTAFDADRRRVGPPPDCWRSGERQLGLWKPDSKSKTIAETAVNSIGCARLFPVCREAVQWQGRRVPNSDSCSQPDSAARPW